MGRVVDRPFRGPVRGPRRASRRRGRPRPEAAGPGRGPARRQRRRPEGPRGLDLPFASRAVTRVRVRPAAATFSTARWCVPEAATCGRCVTTRICSRAASARSFRPTASAVAPETPASTSMKTNVRTGPPRRAPPPERAPDSSSASAAARASWTRESSPPDAIFGSGRGGSPGFGAKANDTVSTPWKPKATLAAGREGARRIALPRDLDGERGPAQREVRQVGFHRLAEARRRGGPPLRELERRLPEGRERFLDGGLRLLHGAFQVGQLLALPAQTRAALDHLGQRRAVLALELREGVETLGDEREARGIRLQLREIAGSLEPDLPEPLDCFREHRGSCGVRRGDLFE